MLSIQIDVEYIFKEYIGLKEHYIINFLSILVYFNPVFGKRSGNYENVCKEEGRCYDTSSKNVRIGKEIHKSES